MGATDTRRVGRGAIGRTLARDAIAGLVAAVVLIANIVSFSALMFPGALAAGSATVLWAFLVGAGVIGFWVAWRTSLPPQATGIDSPAGAVMVLLAAAAGQAVLAGGGSASAAIQSTMLLFTGATLAVGAVMLLLGGMRWGAYLRFVPHFVVAGFTAATAWLLFAGGVRLATGHGPGGPWSGWDGADMARLLAAAVVFGVLLAVQRRARSALALPAALMAMTGILWIGLDSLGLSGPSHGWFLPSIGALKPWLPLQALQQTELPLATALGFVPELLAVAVISVVSLVTKVSAMESMRKTAGDLDQDLRAHGVASLAVAPLGGLASSLQMSTSQLLLRVGGATRWSGAWCAAVLLAVGLGGVDLPALIPMPIAIGLLFHLAYGFAVDSLGRPLQQRAWWPLLGALAIGFACVRFGYLVGILGGTVAACVLFVASYARTGAVRQHLSRTRFPGNVSRSAGATQRLLDEGEAIQIYWLAGYVFFGSCEGVFERVRRDMATRTTEPVRHVILDFGLVSGIDASAAASLVKLAHHCRSRQASLSFSSVPPGVVGALAHSGAEGAPSSFADVHAALAWAEEQVLAAAGDDDGDFAPWLQAQLGPGTDGSGFMAYLERREVAVGQRLYGEGEPADEIDIVAEGRLVVGIRTANGRAMTVRTLTTRTVVGEMGFFRRAPRSASVSAETPATVYTLTRAAFGRMQRDRPELAAAFYEFLLRMLAERIVVSEHMAAAVGR